MNKLLLTCILLLAGIGARAQSTGIGTTTPDASAVLEASSTAKGFLPPRMTAAQRSSIASPATGLQVYQTDGNSPGPYYFDGGTWRSLTNGTPVTSTGYTLDYAVVTTVAGSGTQGSNNGTAASFYTPLGVAVDAAGNIYVADRNNSLIRKITATGVVSTFAGSGYGSPFYDPTGVAVDAAGNVYAIDANGIRKITAAGVVTTFINGTGNFPSATGIAIDAAGNLYVADYYGGKIKKVTVAGVVTTLAGSGAQGSTDGTGAAASFNLPYAVAVDAAGTVYVADRNNHKIRKITNTGVVTTLAGSGSSGSNDGIGAAASFNDPAGVAVDAVGNVYVAERNNHKIRRITAAGLVTTLAGSGSPGSTDATGTAASFNAPVGIAVDAAGNLYVGESVNNKIRKIIAR